MQYGLNEEQEMIVSTVRTFVENEIYPHEELVERTGEVPKEIADDIKRKCQEIGFYACNFPEEVGGPGLSHLEFALVERRSGAGPGIAWPLRERWRRHLPINRQGFRPRPGALATRVCGH